MNVPGARRKSPAAAFVADRLLLEGGRRGQVCQIYNRSDWMRGLPSRKRQRPMSVGHWPFPAAIFAEMLFRHLPSTYPRRPRCVELLSSVGYSTQDMRCSTITVGRHRMQFNQALQVKYCLRPPTPTTAIAINARVEPVSGTDGGLMAVILPIRLAEADAPSKTENLLISLNPPPVTDPNPDFQRVLYAVNSEDSRRKKT